MAIVLVVNFPTNDFSLRPSPGHDERDPAHDASPRTVRNSPSPTATAGMICGTIIADGTAERPKKGAVNADGENQNEFTELLSRSKINISEPP